MNELITIIVPIYNVQKYLPKSINSILQQTYPTLQIILIDDGSTDDSGKICDEFKNLDNRIQVIHIAHSGVGMAREMGLLHAKGKYVGFVDPDDFIDKDMYLNLYKALHTNDADISVCNILCIKDEQESIYGVKINKEKIYRAKECFEKFLQKEFSYSLLNKLFKRELFNNISFDNCKFAEDFYIQVRIFGGCNKVICINKILYYYVKRKESLTETNKLNNLYIYDEFNVYNKIWDNISKIDSNSLQYFVPKYINTMLNLYERCILEKSLKFFSKQIVEGLKIKKSSLLNIKITEKNKLFKIRILLMNRHLFYLIFLYEKYVGNLEKSIRRNLKSIIYGNI